MFCDPTSLPDRWGSQSPGTGRLFLFCSQSMGHVPGPLPHIYPSTVSLPFSNMKEILLAFFLQYTKKHRRAVWCMTLLHSLLAGP